MKKSILKSLEQALKNIKRAKKSTYIGIGLSLFSILFSGGLLIFVKLPLGISIFHGVFLGLGFRNLERNYSNLLEAQSLEKTNKELTEFTNNLEEIKEEEIK